jgi:hypothetical protein
MIEEYAMIWLSLVGSYVFVAASLGITLLYILATTVAHDIIILTAGLSYCYPCNCVVGLGLLDVKRKMYVRVVNCDLLRDLIFL